MARFEFFFPIFYEKQQSSYFSLLTFKVCDQKTFKNDFISLSHNPPQLLGNILIVLSIQYQTIRVFQIKVGFPLLFSFLSYLSLSLFLFLSILSFLLSSSSPSNYDYFYRIQENFSKSTK